MKMLSNESIGAMVLEMVPGNFDRLSKTSLIYPVVCNLLLHLGLRYFASCNLRVGVATCKLTCAGCETKKC